MDLAERLQHLEIFSHLTPAQLGELAPCLALTRYPATVTLFQEGDESREAYLIDSGLVRIQRQTSYGVYVLASLGPGELFGETSFVDLLARSGDAVTEIPSELLVFNPVALSVITDRNQRLAEGLYWVFWKSLSKKLRLTNEKLSQFFASGETPRGATAPSRRDPTGEFRIDLAAKRRLFQEQKLSNLEINFLTTLSREKKLRSGEILFREGEPGDAMYVVLEGRIMISKFIPGGGEEALAFLERGEFFGEMALIDNQPRSADARADTGGAVVLAIPREVVTGILDMHKLSSLRLLKILCALVAKRLRELDDKLVGWFILAGGGSAETPPG